MQLLTGRVFCMVTQANLETIRNLQSCQTKLLAICMDFMPIYMLHTAFLRFQSTEAILMCMESSNLIRYSFESCDTWNIWHLDCLCNIQNKALLNTLWILHSTGGSGHITVFNTLVISHTKHPMEQHISCWPFAAKKLKGSNRQDFVFIRPPSISHGPLVLQGSALVPNGVENRHGLEKALVCIRLSYVGKYGSSATRYST